MILLSCSQRSATASRKANQIRRRPSEPSSGVRREDGDDSNTGCGACRVTQSEGSNAMAELIQKEETTETKTAYGKTLDAAISYSFKWTEYPDFDTLKAAGDIYSED